MSKREFLQHKLINAVIKTDSEGRPVTAGQLGLTKRQTLEALKKAKATKVAVKPVAVADGNSGTSAPRDITIEAPNALRATTGGATE